MADQFSLSASALIRATSIAIPYFSTLGWPTFPLNITKWSYRKFHVASPVSVSLSGYSLVESMFFATTSNTAALQVTYRDNASTNVSLLVNPRAVISVTAISPSLPVVFTSFSSVPTDIHLLLAGI